MRICLDPWPAMVRRMNGLLNKKLSELTSVEVLIYYNHLQDLEISVCRKRKCNTFKQLTNQDSEVEKTHHMKHGKLLLPNGHVLQTRSSYWILSLSCPQCLKGILFHVDSLNLRGLRIQEAFRLPRGPTLRQTAGNTQHGPHKI